MKQKIRFLLAAIMMLVGMTAQAATITVTWSAADIKTATGNTFTKDGVTLAAGTIARRTPDLYGGGTFTTTLGNFTKIEITADYAGGVSGTGWSKSLQSATWTGNAASVSYSGEIWGGGMTCYGDKLTIKFTIEEPTVAVTSITLDPATASMTLGGETLTLTPTVLPDDATDKSVTWTTSDETVATVADGVVTAVAAGTATITATANDGSGVTGTCTVTVAAPATKYSATLAEGTEEADKWTVKAGDGTAQAFPIDGLSEGQTLTLNYTGTRRIKSVTATWTPATAAARTLAEATADDLGKIVGADGYIYDTKAAAEAVATGNAVAMIAYVGSETDNATYTHGLAIALADEGNMNWSTAKTACEGKTAVSGAAWLLPSLNQWKTMFKAYSGSETSYSGLNSALAKAGGTALQELGYWSSTERDEVYADFVLLNYAVGADFYADDEGTDYLVRACLAFGGQAVTPETPTHEYVDLGLSVKWATCNVGAEKPEDYGDYFALGETATKSDYSWSTYTFITDGGKTFTKYNKTDAKTVLDAEDDAATANKGSEWRMPTDEEVKELLNNCTWEWQEEGNTTFGGVAGYKVTGKKAGYTDKYIFLPAAGDRSGTGVSAAGSSGHYWSSSLNAGVPKFAYCLYFLAASKVRGNINRFYGFTVRPVRQN